MAATSVARKVKRTRKPATKLAVMGTAAAAAASLAMGSAPLASAANVDVDQQVLTAGPLVNLLPLFGITSIGPITVAKDVFPPLVNDVNLTLQFVPIGYDTLNIYNTINALPFRSRNKDNFDRVYATSGPTAVQFPAVLSSGIGTMNTVQTYRNQVLSVQGNTTNGFTPFQPGPGSTTNNTNQELLLLRNTYRPNGGLQARFAPILNLFGVDTSMPTPGVVSGNGKKLNTGIVDVSWAYDPIADFPVTLNPFSIANSLFAALPTNLLGGLSGTVLAKADGTLTDLTGLGLSVAGTLGIINRVSGGLSPIEDGKLFYGTIVPNDLPILEPLRLPARILNAIFGWDLGTPFADALQPAFEILVNTGYSDVITPADAPTDPSKWYTRTYTTSNVAQPFLSVAPLTTAEWLQVPGDVFKALITGFRDVFVPPAPQTPPASVVNPAASTVLTVTPAPALAAEPVTEVADEPAAEVALAVQADVAPESAPGSDVEVVDDPADVDPVDVDSPEPAASPRKARGASAVSAPAAQSSEAAAPRAEAVHRSARQDTGSSAPKRAARSAVN